MARLTNLSMGMAVLSVLCLAISAWADSSEVEQLRILAEQGDANAQWSLGTHYYSGQLVGQDYHKAHRWFRLAAEQGHGLAQRSLGTIYEHGLGVPQDYVAAYFWYSLGAVHESERSRQSRESLAKHLTAEQIAEARRLVHEWKPKQ